jgi:CRISPR-associated endoribonuclease Cas6
MRLQIKLTPNTEPVPFSYQSELISALRRWTGGRQYTGISTYGFSWLTGALVQDETLAFPRGTRWTIGAYDEDMLRTIVNNADIDPPLFCGMEAREVQYIAPPQFGTLQTFNAATPILARHHETRQHLPHNDPFAAETLTVAHRSRMAAVGLDPDELEYVKFDQSYTAARPKIVNIGDMKWKGNLCPVIVSGSPAAVKLAWTCGVGHLTGSGCGWLNIPDAPRKK